MLEQTIGESAGGRAQVERGQAGDIQLEMFERVFELVAAAADIFLAGVERDGVVGFDGVAGFAGGLGVDADLAGEDGAFGAFRGFRKGPVPPGPGRDESWAVTLAESGTPGSKESLILPAIE